MKSLSIRTKIIVFFIVVIVFMGFTINIIITTNMEKTFTNDYLKEGEKELLLLSTLSVEPLLSDDLVAVKRLIDSSKRQNMKVVYVVITDSSNQYPVVHTFEDGYPAELSEVFKRGLHAVEFNTETGEKITDFSRPLLNGEYYLHVGLTKKYLLSTIADTRNKISFLTIAALLFGIVFSYATGSMITRQLKDLTKGAEQVRKGNYGYKLPETKFDGEFLEITHSFNNMSTEIQARIDETNHTRNQLETIINGVNLGINVLSRDLSVLYSNKWVNEHLNHLDGHHCYEVFWEKDETCTDCPAMQTFNSGEITTTNRSEILNDGKEHTLKVTAVPIKKDNIVTTVVEILEDITQTYQLQQEIVENRNYLENIIDSLKDAMFVMDEDYTIVKANAAAAKMCGYDKKELIGNKCYKVSHHADTPCTPPDDPCPLKKVRETKAPFSAVHKHHDAKGSEYYVEVSSFPLYTKNGNMQIIEVMHDITKRFITEKELLKKNMELERLNHIARLSQSTSKTKILTELIKELVDLTAMDIGTVHLLKGDTFRIEASQGLSRENREKIACLTTYNSIAGDVYQLKKSVIVENLSEDKRSTIEAVKKSGIKSFISIPLSVQKTILGVISLGSYNYHSFEQDEIDLLETIASHIAATLQRIEMHDAYKKSKEEYANLFESALDGIIIFDSDYRILHINRAGTELFKTRDMSTQSAKRDLIGSDFRAHITYEELGQFTKIVSKIVSGELSSYRKILKTTHPDKTRQFYEYQINPVKTGEVIHIQAMVRDVSEQVQLKEKIQSERKKYQNLVENTPVAVCILQDGIIKFTNKAFMDIYGYPLPQPDTNFPELTSEEFIESMTGKIQLAVKDRHHMQGYESTIECKDGSLKYIEIYPTDIDYADRPAILASIVDITERKKLEEELKMSLDQLNTAYSELEKLNTLRNDFISNVSHELKTPLTTIKGYTELLLDGTMGDVTDEQKRGLRTVFRNSERLQKLISDLLDISKTDSTRILLEPQKTSLKEFINNIAEEMKTKATKKGLTIKTDFSGSPVLKIDRMRFTQVLTNLISNAIKFTHAGSITISVSEKEENIHISIADTGIGISKEALPHIFDRFYQADSSIKRRFGGTGLGLSITKSIVEAHGGTIWAESEVDKGTIFNIILPKGE